MVGNLGELMSDWSKGVTDFTQNGKCSNCGQCCSDILPVSKSEIKKIRTYVAEHHIAEHVNRPPTAVPIVDFTCPFRNEAEKKCDIYAVRPKICKRFQCSNPPAEADKLLYSSSREVISMRQTFFGGDK